MCVHAQIAARAAAAPTAPAVVWQGETTTYGELNRRANRLARYLGRLGVGPETVVGICLDRTPALLVAMLAVLKAGGAYMPMDPAYPAERLAYMLRESGAKAVLTGGAGVALVDCGAPIIDMGDPAIDLERDVDPAITVTERNLAYVIYTSGSTGAPKGAEIEHGNLMQLVTWFQEQFRITPVARVTFVAGLGFDAAVSEVWPCLAGGGCLCLPDEEERLAPHRFRDWLVANGVTVAFAPTPIAERLLTLEWPEGTPLRWVYAGGDQLRRFPPPGLPFRLGNAYGPTECTCIATYAVIPAATDGQSGMPSIGRAVTAATVHILDEQMQPVPDGAAGELYIGGAIVGRGYRGRPDLSAERFLTTAAHGRVYRTGDLVRRLPDGELEFLGRLDGQVKIRGFRIELGEIEVALSTHPDVAQAVVVPFADDRGEKRLVAYVVPVFEAPDGAALREHLRARLPAYMLPAVFVAMQSLPLTPNGKVDRRALPAPDFSAQRADYVAPRTETEAALAGLWAEVLGVTDVGVNDDFFMLGGHSLLATQLLSRVRAVLGAEVTAAGFFAAPTVAGLAGLASQGGAVSGAAIAPVPREGHPPLSFAQARLWFFDQLERGSPLYNIAEAIRLEGPLDAGALQRALTAVVARHEALRTNFVVQGREPVQVIVPPWPVLLPVIDLTGLPAAEREAEVARLSREEARRPFDLTRDPLMRATLLQLAPDDHLLLLTMHHIVSDGWSAGVFYRDLGQAYMGAELPPLPLQYNDFAAWQRTWLAGGAEAEQLAWWREQLAGVPTVLELPTDRPRPPAQSFAGARRSLPLPAPLVAQLQALSREHRATLFMTLLAAYQALLYRYTGQERFLVGAPIANRNRVETEPIIGFFVNTLALPADLRGEPTFRELLARVRQGALGAFAHQDLPFEKLVEALQPERDRSRPPLIQTLFALQNAPMSELRLPGIRVTNPEPTGVDTGTAKYDLILTVEEAEGQFRAVAEYATALYDDATVGRLLGHFERLLEGAVHNPDLPVSRLPLLTEPERQQILVDWNATDAAYPVAGPFVHEVTAQQDAAHTAVTMGARQLTYAELNRRANGLAHELVKLGVRPETPVGVCLERSPELIVALLGVLKAGGAYVAMDPAYPPERLRFMLADSGAGIVVTQERLAPIFGAAALCIEGVSETDAAPAVAVSPGTLAYVIYTSGSTGQPKGVAITHGSLLNLVWWHRRTYGVTPADRATQLAGPGFDAAVWEVWPYLTAGASLHLPDEPTRLSPPALLDWLVQNRISISFLPTPLAEAVLALNWPAQHHLRALLTGGDKLHHYPPGPLGFRLINHYGPTESTVVATAGEVPVAPDRMGAPTIGRPIANIRAYVLDGQLQPLPVGVPGELYVGGAGLARGYVNRPELTAERFVTTAEYGRLYRTGDLVRWAPEGEIEFLGRTDFQVKIRGLRIELGEIESALLGCPGVTDAVVAAREDSPGRQRLVAYLVGAPDLQILRARLTAALPEYMVPSAYVTLERFPLTPNGKVDRRALPAPDPEAGRPYAPPQTATEQQLAVIWAEVLGGVQAGLTDNFFDLGGHSLSATRVIYRMREQLGVELPLMALFETPELGALAARVDAAHPRAVAQRLSPAMATLDADTARLWLDQVQELSEAEVEALLTSLVPKEECDR